MRAGGATRNNIERIAQAEAAFRRMLAEATERGFFGTTSVTLSVQDGHVQHLRVSVERMIK